MKKHSINIKGHPTSISLEEEFWQTFREIAISKKMSASQLICLIDQERNENLSGAIRLFVLETLKQEIKDLKNTKNV